MVVRRLKDGDVDAVAGVHPEFVLIQLTFMETGID